MSKTAQRPRFDSVDREPNPDLHMDRSGTFATSNPVGVRAAEAAPAEVQEFSDYSTPDAVRKICHAKVPGWSSLNITDIAVDQLLEGLSNQLFKVYLGTSDTKNIPCVLFRVQGKDVGTLYDKDQELEIYKMLAGYHIAPRIYANGDGWRIEEWHFSVSLPTQSMRNPSIMAQVAAGMGRLHKLSGNADFPEEIRKLPSAFQERLKDWGSGCEAAANALKASDPQHRVKDLDIDGMLAERRFLEDFVLGDNPKVKGSGLDVVFSHWDSQEGNILQTHYGVRFIDFEYSRMEYQAFDIASYFAECCIDYGFKRYPFYKYTSSDFPTMAEQRLFCAIYLSEYLESHVMPEDTRVTELVNRVQRFVLVSDLCWAFWSVIRAPQAQTYNEFDFIHSGAARWDMYKTRKRALLNGEVIASDSLTSGSPMASQSSTRMRKTPLVLGSGLTICGVLLGVAVSLGMAKALRH